MYKVIKYLAIIISFAHITIVRLQYLRILERSCCYQDVRNGKGSAPQLIKPKNMLPMLHTLTANVPESSIGVCVGGASMFIMIDQSSHAWFLCPHKSGIDPEILYGRRGSNNE